MRGGERGNTVRSNDGIRKYRRVSFREPGSARVEAVRPKRVDRPDFLRAHGSTLKLTEQQPIIFFFHPGLFLRTRTMDYMIEGAPTGMPRSAAWEAMISGGT